MDSPTDEKSVHRALCTPSVGSLSGHAFILLFCGVGQPSAHTRTGCVHKAADSPTDEKSVHRALCTPSVGPPSERAFILLFCGVGQPSAHTRTGCVHTAVDSPTDEKSVHRTLFCPPSGRAVLSNPPSSSKNLHPEWGGDFLAEQQGFEPWRHFHALRDFESRLFDQLEYCSV